MRDLGIVLLKLAVGTGTALLFYWFVFPKLVAAGEEGTQILLVLILVFQWESNAEALRLRRVLERRPGP
jgi:hypothetical protein